MLEATVVFPVILTLMFGILDFGRAIQDYHTADKSMRNAARYLARVPADAVCDWGWDNAQNLAIYGLMDPPNGAKPLIQGWAADTLSLERSPACVDPAAEPMTITISANVPIPTPLMSALISSSVNIGVRHEERHIGG